MAHSAAAAGVTKGSAARLVLDEMFCPVIGRALCEFGYDVVAVADRADLRAMTDAEIFAWAAAQRRWLLTENVKDFRPLLLQALQADTPATGILFTSNRSFPRSRKNPGPLISALCACLSPGPPGAPITDGWLTTGE
jgi:predicted nuclease of predicted toxin-antitoxin system